MKLVDLFVEAMTSLTGVDKEMAYLLAYDTCPDELDPDEEIPEHEIEQQREYFRQALTKMRH
jgi:uncharacterized protein YecA (UPF0149 family)